MRQKLRVQAVERIDRRPGRNVGDGQQRLGQRDKSAFTIVDRRIYVQRVTVGSRRIGRPLEQWQEISFLEIDIRDRIRGHPVQHRRIGGRDRAVVIHTEIERLGIRE